MHYIDANIFIYAVNSKSENSIICKNIIIDIAEGKINAATSVLTWDEFSWVTKRILGRGLAKIESSKLLNMPNLKFLAADETVIRSAQKITENYNIDPRDAIHAATASNNNINLFISDDPDFDGIKEFKRIPIEKVS